MAYEKHNYQSGAVLMASELNEMDDAIEALDQETTQLKDDITHIGVSDNVKVALLNCFQHVAWIDAQGQTYYDALEDALYADSYPRLTAVFNAGVNVIYTDDALDTLKQYLTVRYFATEESAGTVIASNDYTLSGTLTEGTSIITVLYDDVRTTVSIPGVIDFYNIWNWSNSDSVVAVVEGATGLYKNADGVNTAGIGVTSGYPRRAFTVKNGKVPFIDNATKEFMQYYPVPVPESATKVTVTQNQTEYYNAVIQFVLDYETGIYARTTNGAWTQTKNEITLDSGSHRFIGVHFKSSGTGTEQFPTEPVATITFE